MKINISNIGTREWMEFKADISFGLYHALRKLSHEVTMTFNQLASDKLNIIVGADFLANDIKSVNYLATSNLEYVIYEVEKFDAFKINDRSNFNSQSYRALVEAARFIITPYLFNVTSYANYVDSEKIRYAPWGFDESMVSENISRSNGFEFNGLFFGMLKGMRLEKMRLLAADKRTKIKYLGRDDPLQYRDYYISSCKWGLYLSYGITEKFINPFRLYSMGANGMPILTDGGEDDDGYLSLCKKADISDFASHLHEDLENCSYIIERFRDCKLTDNLKDVF